MTNADATPPSDAVPTAAPAGAPPVVASPVVGYATGSPRGDASPVARLLRDRRFLLVAGFMLVAAIGFNAAIWGWNYQKKPLALRVPALDDRSAGLPKEIAGRWISVVPDQPLSDDIKKALGTDQYLNREYADLSAAGTLAPELKSGDPARVQQAVASLRQLKPEAVVRVHMAYYTGLVDTVAHIPDRCMVADGYEPVAGGTEVRQGPSRPRADGTVAPVSYRFTTFDDVTGRTEDKKYTRHVAYLFHVNGQYEANPNQVRARLANLLETHAYYIKVELMTYEPARSNGPGGDKLPERIRESARSIDALYADLLPEVERMLPDWTAATARGK
ncbi:MAG TPA: hypothetical protein VF796_28955 [Humisphaera sp.]